MPTLQVPKDGPLHAKLCKRIESRMRMAEQEHTKRHDKWLEAEERCLAYLPATEDDAARKNKRKAGEPRYTTIQVPYSYGVLMSAHTYWTSVFFARNPIHQFQGRHGEGEMQVQAMEALIGYQVDVGMFTAPYYLWLYDAGKYGVGIVGQYWDKQKLHVGQLIEMPDADPTKAPGLYQTTQEITGYVGNRVYNVSPWDFYPDPRRPVKDFQRGEFLGVRVRSSWNDIIRRRDGGFYNDNTKLLKEHISTDKTINLASQQLVRPWFARSLYEDTTEESKHPAGAVLFEVYVELIPKEWGVGTTTFPQKWVFTITEDYGLIIGAQPLGMVHCQFPFDVLECDIEGYGIYTRGLPEIMEPIQNTVDWLVNTHFFNVRAALNNQFIVDPSKLVVKDVQNSGPGFIWRLRPEAYGTDITKIFYQVPVGDVTRNHMSDFQQMFGIGERISGINDQIMGAINTGAARKTATEIRTTTGFGVNRQKTITEYMSAAGFSSHAQKLVQSSQQMYDAKQKMRRVGSFALDAGQAFIQVSPDDIVGQFDFVPVDGTLPIDRMAQANLWKELLGGIRMMPPQIAQGFDWMRIFAWAAQLAGLKNINQFKVQMVPDQMMAQQAQAGNVIPMRPPGPGLPPPGPSPVEPGNAASTAAGLNALGGEVGGIPGQ